MPLLSLNFGINTTRGLYINEKNESSSFVFRYPYSHELYEHFYSEHAFYEDILGFILKQAGIKKASCPIIATGFPQVPLSKNPFSSVILLDQLVKKIDKFHIVSVADRSVFKHNTFVSNDDINTLQFGQKEKNYLLNMALYNNAIPEKPSEYNLLLANVWNIFNKFAESRPDQNDTHASTLAKPILYMGDIFDTTNRDFEKITYLYILSFVVSPGFHYVALDKHSELVHLAHMKEYSNEFAHFYDEFVPKNLGTLLNSPGDTTCLLQNETGNNQLIEIKSGRIVFIPLNESVSSRVVIKGKSVGNVEKHIKGGKLGFIIDTRHKNDRKVYDYNQLQIDINANLKSINETFGRI